MMIGKPILHWPGREDGWKHFVSPLLSLRLRRNRSHVFSTMSFNIHPCLLGASRKNLQNAGPLPFWSRSSHRQACSASYSASDIALNVWSSSAPFSVSHWFYGSSQTLYPKDVRLPFVVPSLFMFNSAATPGLCPAHASYNALFWIPHSDFSVSQLEGHIGNPAAFVPPASVSLPWTPAVATGDVEPNLNTLLSEPPRQLQFTDMFPIKDLEETAQLLRSELPRCYAARLQQLDYLSVLRPGCLENIVPLKSVQTTYLSCLTDLQKIPKDDRSPSSTRVIRSLGRRQMCVVGALMAGMYELRDLLHHAKNMRPADSYQNISNIESWMDLFLHTFFFDKMSTDLLREQYLAAYDTGSPMGIVRPLCKPADLVFKAAQDAAALCLFHMGVVPEIYIECKRTGCEQAGVMAHTKDSVTISGDRDVQFSCIPKYLYSAVFELLKNAVRASVERVFSSAASHKSVVRVKLTFKGDKLWIEILDNGNGINFTEQNNVWSFSCTTAELYFRQCAYLRNDCKRPGGAPPLAGCGVGLPLSRLYMNYIGADVWLKSTPGEGTSAFLCLHNLLDTN